MAIFDLLRKIYKIFRIILSARNAKNLEFMFEDFPDTDSEATEQKAFDDNTSIGNN